MITRVPKFRMLLGFGVVFAVAFVAAGCGGGDEGITKAELEAALAAAAQPAPAPAPAGPSAAEISQLVSAAVAASAPAGVSSADIAAAVEAAVESAVGAAVESAAGEAVTAADIEALVGKAVEDAVSGGPTPLSASEVQSIVRAAVAAIPTPAPVVLVATPVPAAPAVPGAPTGSVVIVQNLVNPMVGLPSLAPYRDWEQSGTLSITEHLFVMENGNPMTPYLATGWTVAPDGSSVTIPIKQGVPWYTPPAAVGISFGELDAEDVAWFINDNNATTNPSGTSGDAGDFAAVFLEAKAIDKFTVQIGLVQPAPFFGLPLSQFGILGARPSIRSKKVFDKMGPTWITGNAVGTGPFVQSQWISNERGVIEAVPDHWLRTAGIARLEIIQVPELSSRVAMLKTGQADIATVDFKLVAGLQDEGFSVFNTVGDNNMVGISLVFSGNLWEENHARTGDPLDPWATPAYEEDVPWLGNPWGDQVPYTDTNNPPGMSDMEQARLVRWAIAYAIDRDGIVESLLGGLGTPIYSEYMGPLYPGWDPGRTVTKADSDSILQEHGWTAFPSYNVATPLANEQWPWKVPYNPQKAKELLTLAGYPNGFDMLMGTYASEVGEVALEIGDTMIAQLGEIGINVTAAPENYGAVISPRMRKREQTYPPLKNGDVNSNTWPVDWPYPPVDSSISRPGWGVGFEAPFLADMHFKIRTDADVANRTKWHLQTVDWMMYWQLYAGIIQIPKVRIANPETIAAWEGRPEHYGTQGGPEFIRLFR